MKLFGVDLKYVLHLEKNKLMGPSLEFQSNYHSSYIHKTIRGIRKQKIWKLRQEIHNVENIQTNR